MGNPNNKEKKKKKKEEKERKKEEKKEKKKQKKLEKKNKKKGVDQVLKKEDIAFKRIKTVKRGEDRLSDTSYVSDGSDMSDTGFLATIYINGQAMLVKEGSSLYDACQKYYQDIGIEKCLDMHVPNLCHFPLIKEIPPVGKCKICCVELLNYQQIKDKYEDLDLAVIDEEEEGIEKKEVDEEEDDSSILLSSCKNNVKDGMKINTYTDRITHFRNHKLKEILSNHNYMCGICKARDYCQFQPLIEDYLSEDDIKTSTEMYHKKRVQKKLSNDVTDVEELAEMDKGWENQGIKFDPSKCIECFRCVRMCQSIHNMIKMEDVNTIKDFRVNMEDICLECGQCSLVCSTGALGVNPTTDTIKKLLKDKMKTNIKYRIICSIAPSIRVTLVEGMGGHPGDYLDVGKLVKALKSIGFEFVFDTNFAADLTIVEEVFELVQRIKSGGPFPMFTSCCPGWMNLVEKSANYGTFKKYISTCKSPQEMMGALIKEYWKKKCRINGVIKVVSIMPCCAKKGEAQKYGYNDYVITCRELIKLFRMNKISLSDIKDMEPEPFDSLFGESTGAAAIFGTTGGVMEAALRTAVDLLSPKKLEGEALEKIFLRMKGKKLRKDDIRRYTFKLGEDELKVAVAHKIRNVKSFLEEIRIRKEEDEDEFEYHFIEFMCCPGGCIGGGGNPKYTINADETIRKRIDSIAAHEKDKKVRKSHMNTKVEELYFDFNLEYDKFGSLDHLLHSGHHHKTADSEKKELAAKIKLIQDCKNKYSN